MTRWTRRFPGFSLRPARALWVFVVAVPVIGLAALNTGNNALYLLLSIMLGAFVASGALSRHTLGHLEASVTVPADVFAGSPVAVRVRISNTSHWLPAAGVRCQIGTPAAATLAPVIPPGGERELQLVTVLPRRGRHALAPVTVAVALPLGFFVKSVRLASSDELLVYPRRFPGAASRLASLGEHARAARSRNIRRGGEVELLREYLPGDDVRDVHWKQTARQQRPIVVERRDRHTPARYVVLDRQVPRRDDPEQAERFEMLVSEVATAVLNRLRRGDAIGLVIGSSVVPPKSGPAQVRRLLERLALVEAVGPGEDPLPDIAIVGAVYRLAVGA